MTFDPFHFSHCPYLDIFQHKNIPQKSDFVKQKQVSVINHLLETQSHDQLLQSEKEKFSLAVLNRQNTFIKKQQQKIVNKQFDQIQRRFQRSKSQNSHESNQIQSTLGSTFQNDFQVVQRTRNAKIHLPGHKSIEKSFYF